MSFRRSLDRLLNPRPTAPVRRARLGVEWLEGREVPTVSLRPLPDTQLPDDRPLFVPVTPVVSDAIAPVGAVSVTASTDNPNVTAEVVQGGRTLQFDVTGTDSAGVAFSGTLSLRLFENQAPLATTTLVALANEGFFNGKLFHRVLDNFVIQGGSPNGDGLGGSSRPDVVDEFNPDLTFASLGIVAMANARDDNNNSQFFITDIDQPLSGRPEFLNFNHSIVGLLTGGFDTYQRIITTPVTTSPTGERSSPVNPVTITTARVVDDTTNAVVKLTPTGAVTGTVNLTVTAADSTNRAVQTTPLTVTAETVNSRAILNPVAPLTIGTNGSGTFTISATDIDGDQLTYQVGTTSNLFGTPTDATVQVDQATGRVTVTPTAGFTGTFDLLVGVRDQTDRSGSLNASGNFDTQTLTVTVRDAADVSVSLAVSQAEVRPNASVVLTATVASTATPNGTVQFFADGTQIGATPVSNGTARLTTNFPSTGTRQLTSRFVPDDTATKTGDSAAVALNVTDTAPANITLTATGATAGSEPRVTVMNSDGTERFNFLAFAASFTGGVRAVTADVTNDGQEDIVVTPRFGGAPLIRIYDGVTGDLVRELMVFEETFRGGLYVDVGDALGLGYSQVLVGAGDTGGPRVTLFDHVTGQVVLNYFAYDPNFRGGVSIDFSDLTGSGNLNLITGPGKGGGPQVKVFNPRVTAVANAPTEQGVFVAGSNDDTAGIRVGSGGLNENGRRNILVGPVDPDTAPLTLSFDAAAQGVNLGESTSTT